MKCLYCYRTISKEGEFHASCSKKFFGSYTPPTIPYSFSEMAELAKNVVERSITVPGVQPKLSMSIIEEARKQWKPKSNQTALILLKTQNTSSSQAGI